MTQELVSVVIPTFNYRTFVTEAVDSALAQTYQPVEVIVVDDGSTDRTDEALAPYGDRIRYLYQANQGLSGARNTGIRAARGRFVALLDSDDLWHPQKLEMQMRYLGRHPQVGLLAAAPALDISHGWKPLDPWQCQRGTQVTLEHLVIRSRFGPSSVVIRRDCFDRVGFFDPDLRSCEDRDMWIRIAAHFPMVKLPEPLWWYRVHPGAMHKAAARMEEYEFRVLRKAMADPGPRRLHPGISQKALAFAYFAAAIRYEEAGRHWQSLLRLARSLWKWPLRYRPGEVRRPLERFRMLGVIILRLLGLKGPPADEGGGGEPLASREKAIQSGQPA
jgi:glycosyltransferase involved in cell wall biosynthesis